MKQRFTPEEIRMIDYLLGRLPEGERQEFAERALADDETWTSLLAMEETLLDAYARGEIEPAEAQLIERTLLATADGQTKLRTARALLERQRRAQPTLKRVWWLAAAAAVLLAVAGVSLLYRSKPTPVSPPPLATIVLQLQAFRDRSGSVPRVSLPPGAGMVTFAVPIPEADRAASYFVTINTPSSARMIIPAREARDGRVFSVRCDVPREALSSGRYEVEVHSTAAGASRLLAYAAVDLLE